MVVFRKKKGEKKARPINESKPKGIPKEKLARIDEGEGLSRAEINKKLQERQVRIADLATADEIKKGEARLVSLNPKNPELDNIVVAKDSPVLHNEVDILQNPDLRKKELERIKDSEKKDE